MLQLCFHHLIFGQQSTVKLFLGLKSTVNLFPGQSHSCPLSLELFSSTRNFSPIWTPFPQGFPIVVSNKVSRPPSSTISRYHPEICTHIASDLTLVDMDAEVAISSSNMQDGMAMSDKANDVLVRNHSMVDISEMLDKRRTSSTPRHYRPAIDLHNRPYSIIDPIIGLIFAPLFP